MSRIAKYPVDVPKGVEVTINTASGKGDISIKGPLGTLKQSLLPSVTVERQGEQLFCKA